MIIFATITTVLSMHVPINNFQMYCNVLFF